eukprot:TRINITY_DN9851_c1_g1_i1.p1 TRINITY_DN9851_c1_g1~~TRINITY_DN9851_c1_g1_i1.p1  ORF type:complete len:969 (-),score=104.45 TRINITY_DN9851_c1_g1_i1:112-3018(-)
MAACTSWRQMGDGGLVALSTDDSQQLRFPNEGVAVVEPQALYRCCRRLTLKINRIFARSACPGFLLFVFAVILLYFLFSVWWNYVHRWPIDEAIARTQAVKLPLFGKIGCYPLMDGDDGGDQHPTNYRDNTCNQRAPVGQLCRSGLPFFTFANLGLYKVGWRTCAQFCLLKGLDVSGVVDASRCRCGASSYNLAVWREARGRNRADLAWQPSGNAVANNSSPLCRIVAAQYFGPMPIPRAEMDISDGDLAYIKGILLGVKLDRVADIGQPNDSMPVINLTAEALEFEKESNKLESDFSGDGAVHIIVEGAVPVKDQRIDRGRWSTRISSGTNSPWVAAIRFRRCFPHQCSSGLPWPIQSTYRLGIPYAFAVPVPDFTREAFRAATSAFHATTCVRFTEVSPSFAASYKIVVTEGGAGCWTSPMGYPILHQRDTQMNLGWCNSDLQIGNMIHELGHVLGMAHEHTRPDRDHWVRINATDLTETLQQQQFDKNPQAFVGSLQHGSAPYDYGSVMHYPADRHMQTLPIVDGRGIHDAEIGQRRGLSALDVKQLRDMYRCDHAADIQDECIDMNDELALAVRYQGRPARCSQLGAFCTHPFYGELFSYFCRVTCNTCPRPRMSHVAPAGIHGCEDASVVCSQYRDYCPGGIVGNEEWMSQYCRRTCQIPLFCGRRSALRGSAKAVASLRDVAAAPPRASVAAAPAIGCIDSSETGFLNSLGQAASCMALEDRCLDTEHGGAVQRMCPATCGVCRQGDPPASDAVNPMVDSERLVLDFELNGAGFDLAHPAQQAELLRTLDSLAPNIWQMNVTVDVSSSSLCQSPCRRGSVTVSALCCKELVPGCRVACEALRGQLLGRTAAGYTTRFRELGLASLDVTRMRFESYLSHSIYKVFLNMSVIEMMIFMCVEASVCLCFALTHFVCFKVVRRRGDQALLNHDQDERETQGVGAEDVGDGAATASSSSDESGCGEC